MEISYKFSPKEVQKLSKFKNPSVILKKENIVKNGKYKIHLTKNMFNELNIFSTLLLSDPLCCTVHLLG